MSSWPAFLSISCKKSIIKDFFLCCFGETVDTNFRKKSPGFFKFGRKKLAYRLTSIKFMLKELAIENVCKNDILRI